MPTDLESCGETSFQSSCCSGSLAEMSCAPSSALGYSPKLHKTFISGTEGWEGAKKHRRNTRFNCPQQQSAAQQLRAAYPEVAEPGATPTPHLKRRKRTAPGKRNCVFWIFFFFFFLLLSIVFLTDPIAKATPMTSAHLSSFSSSHGAQGPRTVITEVFVLLSKPLADKQGES